MIPPWITFESEIAWYSRKGIKYHCVEAQHSGTEFKDNTL